MTRRRLAVLLVALVLVGAGGVGAYLALRGPSYPDAWDPRVLPFVEIVERERDLEFEHPVHVDFLSEEEFTSEVTADEDELSDEDREELEQMTGTLRALGLVSGEVDLFDQMNDLMGGGVIGLYSAEDKRIRMRGTELTPAVKATLVHELTHVLQDQHFDLAAKAEELDELDDSSASAGWEALVEGDANRIESAYTEQLSDQERQALEKDQDSQRDDARDRLEDVPEALQAMLGSSYAFGEALLALAVQLDGSSSVDSLFAEPPTTEEHLLDPWTLLEDEDEALEVRAPKLREGEEQFDSGTFGSPAWLMVLAERVDLRAALRAADGWGGDAYVAFERDGRACVRVAYRGDTPEDLQQLHRQLDRWVAAGPRGVASVSVQGKTLTFESCDPGSGGKAGREASQEALELAVGRTWLSRTVLQEDGVPEAFARCLAHELVMAFTLAQLNDSTLLEKDPDAQQTIQGLARGCV